VSRFLLLAAAFIAVPIARAEESAVLDEVIISASLRRQTLEQMPTSVTVIRGDTLALAGEQHLQDVLGLIPNLNWAAGTSRPRYYQLRGIGENDQFQGAPNASVGFLIDGIDFSGVGGPATLYDVDQVEVLRGPQGTTYGANALAGLINVHTRDPQLEPELKAEFTAGDYGTWGYGAVIGGAVGDSDKSAYRVVAQKYKSDGFRRNTFLNRDDTNGYDETTVRGKFRWDASDALRVDFTAMFVDLDNGYDAFSIDNSRVTLSDDPGRDAQRSTAFAAHIEYSGFDGFGVESTTSFADSDIDYSFDGDWGNNAAWGVNAPYDYFSEILRDRTTWSQDLRLVSDADASAALSWVAGLYVLHAEEDNDQRNLADDAVYDTLNSDFRSTSVAAYGELDLELTDRTAVSFGARVENRDAKYDDTHDVSLNPQETMLGGHLSLTYALAERSNLYATLSRGYKAGGFNIDQDLSDDVRKYDAEYLWNVETGIKARDAEGRFDLQAAVFFMRRTDQQVDSSTQLDPGDPLSYVLFIDNAARGENFGFEGNISWNATQRLQLSSSVGLLHTRYIDYEYGPDDDRVVVSGREQATAPEYQVGFGVQYRDPTGWLARVDTQSVDDFYFSASHNEKSDPYTLVHVKLGYATERWSAFAWMRNAFDEEYSLRGFYFGNEPPDYPDKRYVQAGDPRTVGVTVNYSFR